MVIEIDGDSFHHETPVEAHNRTTMLQLEGAIIERVNAIDCETPEKAKKCAERLLTNLERHKNARR